MKSYRRSKKPGVKYIISSFLILLLLFLLAPASAFSAVDMFLKIDGIEGESRDVQHKDEIDVLAFSEGLSDSGGFMQLSVTKYVDKSSPLLRRMVASKQQITKARLTVRSAGDKPVPVFVIDLDDVVISSVSGGGSGGEDRLTENVTLNFERVIWTYTPIKDDGSGGGTVSAQWDLTVNSKRQ